METVDIRCKRCNKVIARLTPENAAYGAGVKTLCMPCTKPKPYLTWVDIRERQAEQRSKTVREQIQLLEKRGKAYRAIVKDCKRHSKFKHKY